MSLQKRKVGKDPVSKKKKTVEELEKEIQELRQQNLKLTIENEFIKKLDALIRKESQQNGKKHK